MDKENVSLNKYISSSGFCSRREADKLIEQARVTINGELVVTAIAVHPGDLVEIDGEPVHKTKVRPIYIAFNKPVGVTSTTDVKDRSNIIYFINHPKRIFPIGRLDKDSDGLIFLTNDGDIVNKILRASNNHEKEYIVSVDKAVTPDFIKKMGAGVPVLGTVTKKCHVRQDGTRRFKIVLTQGLNRQIRRMCEYFDYKVMSLTRVRIMNVELGNLGVGKWRYLTIPETDRLNAMVAESGKTEHSKKTGFVEQKKESGKDESGSGERRAMENESGERRAAKPAIKNADAKKAVMKRPKVAEINEDAELEAWIEKRSAPKRTSYAEFKQGAKGRGKEKKEGRFEKSKLPGRNAPAIDPRNKKGAPPKGKATAKPGKTKEKKSFAPSQTQSVKQYIPKKKKR
jgi:23S rRNA pseudouridine2604 synthase